MKDLAIRLAALDTDAGAAMRAVAYFDKLIEARAGLHAVVRGAAVLAGCPVRLVDVGRRLQIRVRADGRPGSVTGPPDPSWANTAVDREGAAVLWLERPKPAGTVDAVVLERAAAAARIVLDRTRGPASTCLDDAAAIEVVIDANAPVAARSKAARQLGLPQADLARAVALHDGQARIELLTDKGLSHRGYQGRQGIGPGVPILDLPRSWAAAKVALRFTAEGTEEDPGPRVVHAERLGGLTVLASVIHPTTSPIPDVHALNRAAAAAPWMLSTLYAVATHNSLRAAATELCIHHSTLQNRVAQAEHLLGWLLREPAGLLRLQLALVLRRLHNRPL